MSLERSDTEIITPSVISSQDVSRMASDNEASQASLGSSLNLSRNLTTSLATIEYESGGDEEKEEESSRPAKRKRGEDTDLTNFKAGIAALSEEQLQNLLLGILDPEREKYLRNQEFFGAVAPNLGAGGRRALVRKHKNNQMEQEAEVAYYDNVDHWKWDEVDSRVVEGTLGDSLQLHNTIEDRAVGTILGCMCGDILGVPFEGLSISEMMTENSQRNGAPLWKHFVTGKHMGLYQLPTRYGMYSDDTNSTLALATSLVEKQGLMALHAAHTYGRFWQSVPQRGYPDSAKAVMKSVLKGADLNITGRVSFPAGSFANGGIMRISPVGVTFRNATEAELLEATTQAIVSSHVHPEAIDGAFVQAYAITLLLKLDNPSELTPEAFLTTLHDTSKNQTVAAEILLVKQLFITTPRPSLKVLARTLGASFQIKAVDALGCSLWAFVNNWNNPEQAVMDAVALGGDTDTLAAITGALCGALHGTHWIPKRWYNNIENGDRGRDYAVGIAKQLAKLDLHGILVPTPEEEAQIKEESAAVPIIH